MTARVFITLTALMMLSGCAAKIYGTVELVDSRLQPVPSDKPQGTVVNMINTTAAVEQASASATTNEKGQYESPKDSIKPGKYKVEANRIGYATETKDVEVGKMGGEKVEFKLQKIDESKRKALKGAVSDEDKIINPGEVNIQPPAM